MRLQAYALKASKTVKRIAYLIAAIGAAGSYGTQVALLQGYDMGTFAYVVPATIDLLAICAAIGLNIPGVPEGDKKYMTRVLTIAVLVSISANMAGGHNWVARLGHAWPVVAYLFAEGIANRIRTFVARVEAEQAETVPQPEIPAPVQATAAVSKPTAAAIKAKPTSAKARILELAAATPRPSDEEIAAQVGTKTGWVKHVVKTSKED
jgi:hypothetical protein